MDRSDSTTMVWRGLVTLAVLASACSGATDSADPVVDGTLDAAEVPAAEVCVPLDGRVGGAVASAPVLDREFPWARTDPVVLDGVDLDAILPGGPPPDGIQPIDDPCLETVDAADVWLEDRSPVMVVTVGDDTRAYPLAIMTQHEIVNDVVGGEPVVVTYCPLCNSGLAFLRTVDGQVLDFGTSGRLYQSNLVMYDRQTKSLWTQFAGEAIVGVDFVGTRLERLATNLVSWDVFVESEPGGLVLSRDSVPGRDYGRNPYPGYEGSGDTFLFEGPRDDRLPPNTRVVGVGADSTPVAVVLDELREQRVVTVTVDEGPVTVWWAPGQASALDAATVDDGVDVGSAVAVRPVLPDGRVATFTPAADQDARFVDDLTGSTWTLLGEAVDGPLTGTALQRVPLDDTFWFVWFAFRPGTDVVGTPD